MSRNKIIVVLVLTFLSGALVGAVLTSAAIRRQARHFLTEGPRATQEVVLRTVSRRLAMTAEQKEKARPVVSAALQRLSKIRANVQPEVETVLEDTIRDLRPILTDQQVHRLDDMHSRLKSRWALPAGAAREPAGPGNP
jgi:hypothetical protein